jgi:hypothetical protein
MGTMTTWKSALVVGTLGCLAVWFGGAVPQMEVPGIALAADSLNVEGLPKDPKAFRAQVDQILSKATSLIDKLKGNEKALPAVLDLMQTRDNVLREIPKMESTPDGSKWTLDEGRASVEAMLKLLRDQYDKAATLAS